MARVVELLSQSVYREGKVWADFLAMAANSKMRSQWTRAWLLGPLAAASIETDPKQFESVVTANDCRLLKKALVWFQAEKTTPNPSILAGTLPRDQRIRIADILSWPSDFQEYALVQSITGG